ncbi:MAG: TPM domain-containing protein [Ruminococcus bromii]|nr:TPM domain-containing protein [Ruminococcus bromii]
MTSVHQAGVRRILSLLLAFILVFSVCAIPALANEAGDLEPASADGSSAIPQPTVDFYVYDEANVLSAETKSTILAKNAELNEKYGVQIVVMTVSLLPGSDLESRATYLTSVIQSWKVGGEQGNGLILALSISDEDYVAVAGNNFKPEFTNVVLKNLLNEQLEPDFKNKAYDAGVAKFFTAAAQRAETYAASLAASAEPSGEPEASAVPEKTEDEKSGGSVFLSILKFLGTFVLVLLALAVISLIVIQVHGQMVRKKRREARRRRAQQRGGAASARRTETGSVRRLDSVKDSDYRAFMDRYK